MNLAVGQSYKVKVVKFTQAGAIVELEDKSTQFIHISQISDKFVHSIGNFLTIGNTYDAVAIEGKARPVELSLRHLHLNPKTQEEIDKEDEGKSFEELLNEYTIDNSKKFDDIADYKKDRRRDRIKNKKGHRRSYYD